MERVRLIDKISTRLSDVRRRIDGALERGGRGSDDDEVVIVAVTKKFGAASVDAAVAAGLTDVGENRVQEASEKIPCVRSQPRWHLIGHLQRNKARRALELFSVIHSVDSLRLVDALAALNRPVDVFLQVNIAGEAQKYGVAPRDARALLRRVLASETLHCVGLMTMAPYRADPEAARPHFRALRQLRADLNAAGDGPPLAGLSMGMSGDFEIAVEEGATHVRIGTALLGLRKTGTPEDRT